MKTRLLFVGLIILGFGLSPAQGQDNLLQKGKEIYAEDCADCHRLNGRGLPGTFPALDGNSFVVGPPKPVIVTVLKGRHGKLGQMPAWKDKLDDSQIAAVVTYIRHAWSNQAPGVTQGLVAEMSQKLK